MLQYTERKPAAIMESNGSKSDSDAQNHMSVVDQARASSDVQLLSPVKFCSRASAYATELLHSTYLGAQLKELA
jgi:hypothetical protein